MFVDLFNFVVVNESAFALLMVQVVPLCRTLLCRVSTVFLWKTLNDRKIFSQPLVVLIMFVEFLLMQMQFRNGFSLLLNCKLLIGNVCVC